MLLNQTDPHRTLRIVGNTSSTLKTLKDRFLDDIHMYSCSVSNFYTNEVPPLFPRSIPLAVRIFAMNTKDAPIGTDEITDPSVLHPDPHFTHTLSLDRTITSVTALIMRLHTFFADFNKNLHLYGSNIGNDPQLYIDGEVPPPPPSDSDSDSDGGGGGGGVVGWSVFNYNQVDPHDHIQFGFDSGGLAVITASDEFLSQFYIRLDPILARVLNLPEFLFGASDGVNVITSFSANIDKPYSIIVAPNYSFDYTMGFNSILHKTTFISRNTIYTLDMRYSIELECSFHFSRTIYATESSYIEKFILAEFPLSDYKDIRTDIDTWDDSIITSSILSDKLEGGLTDLCHKNPESHVVHCLPGSIQSVNTRINVVYRDPSRPNTILPFEFIDGFYDFVITFVKKIDNNVK